MQRTFVKFNLIILTDFNSVNRSLVMFPWNLECELGRDVRMAQVEKVSSGIRWDLDCIFLLCTPWRDIIMWSWGSESTCIAHSYLHLRKIYIKIDESCPIVGCRNVYILPVFGVRRKILGVTGICNTENPDFLLHNISFIYWIKLKHHDIILFKHWTRVLLIYISTFV